jgi:hypothetical protein
MTTDTQMTRPALAPVGKGELLLAGLDGGNPLAFLAALGTLEGLSRQSASTTPRMAWRVSGMGWSPVLMAGTLDEDGLVNELVSAIKQLSSLLDRILPGEKDLGIPADAFRGYAEKAFHDTEARYATDWIAAIGCDAVLDETRKTPTIQDTALRTMSGSGHQHFLEFGRNLLTEAQKDPALLRKALFAPWQYDDPVKNLTLRLDPVDDSRYALQWQNPSTDGSRARTGSVLGANALAFLGLSVLPTAPRQGRLETTGFKGRRASDTYWTWPIWDEGVGMDAVRSLLQLPQLQKERPAPRALKTMGVAAVFRSQRLTVGKYRNFSPAKALVT